MSRKLIWNSFWQWNTDNKVALDETRTPTATETTTTRNNSTVMNCLKWLIGIYLGFRFIYSCRYISTCTYTPPASPIMLSLVSVPLLGNIQRDFSRLIPYFARLISTAWWHNTDSSPGLYWWWSSAVTAARGGDGAACQSRTIVGVVGGRGRWWWW